MALHHPCGVAYEPARSCRPYTGTSPAPGRRLVARPGEACAPADDLLLRRLQPDLMDQAPDPGRARRRVQWLFHCHVGSVIGWKSGAGNGQTALYAPRRRRADDPDSEQPAHPYRPIPMEAKKGRAARTALLGNSMPGDAGGPVANAVEQD